MIQVDPNGPKASIKLHGFSDIKTCRSNSKNEYIPSWYSSARGKIPLTFDTGLDNPVSIRLRRDR